MAQPSTIAKAQKVLFALAFAPITIPKYLATEPTLTGALLYILTRPATGHRFSDIRARILSFFRSLPYLSTNAVNSIHARSYGLVNLGFDLDKSILVLKALFAVGVLSRINLALNQLALNNYQLELPGIGRVLGSSRGAKRVPWKWDGKTELIVITGGCSGFGYEMVKGFAGKAKIVVIDVSDLPKELERLPEVYYYRCDLTDFDAITSTADSIRNRLGNPTVLINNAGIGIGKNILDTPTSSTKAIFAINLTSHIVLIKEFLPGMLAARKGHIVGISSMAAFISAPGLVDYCVTKVGVVALHEGLRNELLGRYENGHTIANTTVHPSWHATGIIKGSEAKLEEFGIKPDPPVNVSNAVVEQVLAHRSGKIFMPRSEIAKSGTRQLPLWFQDWALGNVVLNPFKNQRRASAKATGMFGDTKDA